MCWSRIESSFSSPLVTGSDVGAPGSPRRPPGSWALECRPAWARRSEKGQRGFLFPRQQLPHVSVCVSSCTLNPILIWDLCHSRSSASKDPLDFPRRLHWEEAEEGGGRPVKIPLTHSHGGLSSCRLRVPSFLTSLCCQVPFALLSHSFPRPCSCGSRALSEPPSPCWEPN